MRNKTDIKSHFYDNKDVFCLINDNGSKSYSTSGEISNPIICHSKDKFNGEISRYIPITSKPKIGLWENSTSKIEKRSLSVQVTQASKEAQWSKAVSAVFRLAESLDIKYPGGADISQAQKVYEILYNITAHLNDTWVRLINKEAYLVPSCLMDNFTLQFHSEERVFIVQTKEDIILRKQEKTVILIFLFINISYPLEVIDGLAANEDFLSTTQLITFNMLTQAENLEVLNLSMIKDCVLKRGSIILKLKPLFPMMHCNTFGLKPVHLYLC